MPTRLRRISYAVAGLAMVLLFQNCAANQNFDLQQASKVAESSGGEALPPDPEDVSPAPTPTPDTTDSSSKGAYCAVAPGAMPKWQITIADLAGQNISAPTNLSFFFTGAKVLTSLSLYKADLTQKSVNVSSEGYSLGNGRYLRRANNSLITSHFATAADSYLQLASETAGWYQLGVAASGFVELELGIAGASNKMLIQNLSGPNDVRLSCANQRVYIRRGEQLPIRIRHLQTANPNITLALLMRKVSTSDNLNPSYCGQVNDLFTATGSATAAMTSILNAGWKALAPANFVMIPDGKNLVQNGDFEDTTGFSVPTSPFYLIRSSLPSWNAYGKFELQGNGLGGIAPFRGGKFWVELDSEEAIDALWQSFPVDRDSRYRYMLDYTTHSGIATNTAGIEVWRVDETANDFTKIDTIYPTNNGSWQTYENIISTNSALRMRVKLRELDAENNFLGAFIDNVVYRKIRESDQMCRPGASSLNNLRIMSAIYGAGSSVADATPFVRGKCEGEARCGFMVDNNMAGDPKAGFGKALQVKIACPKGEVTILTNEGQTANLSCP